MHLPLCASIVLLVCTACQTTSPPRATLAADALLTEVSPAEQRLIAKAREANDRANDAYAAAKAHTTTTRDGQISADLDLEEAVAKVARANANLDHKKAAGTTEAVDGAKRELELAKAEHTAQAAAATLGARQTDHARALAEIAKEHVTVTEAQVELAKAKAVNTLDRRRARSRSSSGSKRACAAPRPTRTSRARVRKPPRRRSTSCCRRSRRPRQARDEHRIPRQANRRRVVSSATSPP
jgi:hypothetical protein